MTYRYTEHRAWLFTEQGSTCFLKFRDNAKALLDTAGAFCGFNAFEGVSCGDTDRMLACLDRLVELGDVRCLNPSAWGQHQVFVRAQ